MSAWIVSKAHIDALVTAAVHGASDAEARCQGVRFSWSSDPTQPYGSRREFELRPGDIDGMTRAGQMLLDECVASVAYRYPEDTDESRPGSQDFREPYRFDFNNRTSVEVLKAIACYEYQSCEHPGWFTSEARSFCENLQDRICGELPGYDAAPWGIEAQAGAVA